VRIPVSLCLPAECNKSSIFQPYLDTLSQDTNDAVLSKMSLGTLYDMLETPEIQDTLFKYSGDQNLPLLRQLTGLANNDTTI
jgi:hypothetical protein